MGILEAQPGVPGSHIWDEERIRAIDLPLCAAGIHPDASPDELDLSSGWLAWGTYGDDWFPVVHGRARDLAGRGWRTTGCRCSCRWTTRERRSR
ncbi:hypothetical protein [Streptomyces sp. S063]|uniref:hypothetical protein n=1 Tax=Streptomyces sp. S063 TaxID=2005885 RepID=UPI003FCE00E2